jgi:hypothetical protein
MPQSFERRTISFVIRLWVEPAPEQDTPLWRGQIEHVGSGETMHFQIPTPLLEFFVEHLRANPTEAERDSG